MSSQFIWLASFPRSGNTLLRTILYHCFGLKSASVYPNDLAGNKALEEYIGHVELEADANGSLRFPTDRRWLVKTHELPPDDDDSIYVVRDGRAACVSYWEFYDRKTPLESIITGQTRFGAWSEHVNAWAPWTRSNCLLLKYEDMVEDMPSVIKAMSQYLDQKAISLEIPDRSTIVQADGLWVRPKSDWRSVISDSQLTLFHKIHGPTMSRLKYDTMS